MENIRNKVVVITGVLQRNRRSYGEVVGPKRREGGIGRKKRGTFECDCK